MEYEDIKKIIEQKTKEYEQTMKSLEKLFVPTPPSPSTTATAIPTAVTEAEAEFVSEECLWFDPSAAERRKWNEWHMIREFVQNSLDAATMVDIIKTEDGVMISDKGTGFDIRAFIIGRSTKRPECDRGRFGEGMKYAVSVAILKGYDITIYSKDTMFKFAVKEKRGAPVLYLREYRLKRPIQGTVVKISNYVGPTFRERFLLYDGHDAYKILHIIYIDKTSVCDRPVIFAQCIMDPRGDVFVRDIFVERKEDMLFSYNLVDVNLDADRNIVSGLQYAIRGAWRHVKSIELVRELISRLQKAGIKDQICVNAYEGREVDWSYLDYIVRQDAGLKAVWEQLVREYEQQIGKKLCHCPSVTVIPRVEWESMGQYTAAGPYFTNEISAMLYGARIIPHADDVIQMFATANIVVIREEDLLNLGYTEKELEVIKKWMRYFRRIYNVLTGGKGEYKIVIARVPQKQDVPAGLTDHTAKMIYIMDYVFDLGFEEVFHVFTHELTHALNPDLEQDGNEIEFLRRHVDVLIKIQKLTLEKLIRPPTGFTTKLKE
jgi:hypothetical protein